MTKIVVFDKIDDLSHIGSFEQLFHCRDSVINTTNAIKSSTFSNYPVDVAMNHSR